MASLGAAPASHHGEISGRPAEEREGGQWALWLWSWRPVRWDVRPNSSPRSPCLQGMQVEPAPQLWGCCPQAHSSAHTVGGHRGMGHPPGLPGSGAETASVGRGWGALATLGCPGSPHLVLPTTSNGSPEPFSLLTLPRPKAPSTLSTFPVSLATLPSARCLNTECPGPPQSPGHSKISWKSKKQTGKRHPQSVTGLPGAGGQQCPSRGGLRGFLGQPDGDRWGPTCSSAVPQTVVEPEGTPTCN